MVASTDIKFYVHTNNNAPQLQNAYGSMINVLDACLIDGIQIGVVNSLTASGNTVTATFGAAHNLMQHQVIKITGAAQAEFNGEHRILTIPDSNSITFELATAPSVPTATGAISASLPPLGWEKPFSSSNPNGGGKAAYRSLNLLLPSRPFLRVVDERISSYSINYAKYAKVGIVEDMTGINTMLGVQAPFDAGLPSKNWAATGSGGNAINGWAKWYYARNPYVYNTEDNASVVNGNRQWVVLGSEEYFYILPCVTPYDTDYPITDASLTYGFGVFERAFNHDLSNVFLIASIMDFTASTTAGMEERIGLSGSAKPYILLSRPLSQISSFATARSAFNVSLDSLESGYTNYTSNTQYVALYPVILEENTVNFQNNMNTIRGVMPGVYGLASRRPFADKLIFLHGSDIFFAKLCLIPTKAESGQMVFKAGEL